MEESQRRCSVCGKSQPLEHFRSRGAGTTARRYECRGCHRAAVAEHRAAARERLIRGVAADVKRRMPDGLGVVTTIVKNAVRKLGGSRQFWEAWREAMKRCEDSKRPLIGWRLMNLILQLHALSAPALSYWDDFQISQMSDAELLDYLRQHLSWLLIATNRWDDKAAELLDHVLTPQAAPATPTICVR